MPANLTPMYHKAEREYRRATTPREQLACLETMLALIPKHKGTDKLQADIKRKLKETREEVAAGRGQLVRGPKIARQGCGQVVVIGGPNAGKSQLVAALTNARPEVAPYPFTTRTFTPGMMEFEQVTIQLVDTPPIAVGSLDPQLLNLIRATDLVLLCLNGGDDDSPEATAAVLEELKIRKTSLAAESGFLEDELSMLGVRARLVLTAAGSDDAKLRYEMFEDLSQSGLQMLSFEANDAAQTSRAKAQIFASLGIVRVYTKRPGRPVELVDPFTLPIGSTVADVAAKVHAEIADKLQFAKVWPQNNAVGQTVGREHPVNDGDVVELHS